MAADALLEAPPSSQFVPGNKGVAQIYQQHHLNLNHFDRYIWEWRWGAGTLPNLQIIRSWKINGQSGTQRWCMDNLMRAYLDLHFADFLLSAITPFGHRRSPVCSSCREGLATVVSCNPFLHAGLRHFLDQGETTIPKIFMGWIHDREPPIIYPKNSCGQLWYQGILGP